MIKVGDLVCTVLPRLCGCDDSVGTIFVVRQIESSGRGKCTNCRGLTFAEGTLVALRPNGNWTELRRLKRIDPLPESEDTKEREEMRI